MAFRIVGQSVINDSREIENITKATISGFAEFGDGVKITGINTVDGSIEVTGAGSSISATTYYGDGSNLTGVIGESGGDATLSGNLDLGTLSVSGLSDLTDVLVGGAITVTGKSQYDEAIRFGAAGQEITEFSVDGTFTSATDGQVPTALAVKTYVESGLSGLNDGSGSVDILNANIQGWLAVGSTATFADAARFDSSMQFGAAGQAISEFSIDGTLADDSDSAVPTEKAVKTYVDAAISSAVGGDTGNITVTNGEFSGWVSVGQTITVDGAARLDSSLQFGELGQPVSSISIDQTLAAAADTELATALAVKSYVDSQVGAANQLNFVADDGINTGQIDLATESLDIDGTPNQIVTDVTAANGNELVIGLADDTKITTSLIVGEGLGGNAGDLLNVAGGTVSVDGNISVTGNVDSASDRKLKENITVIPDALEKINALRGVEYNWIASGQYSAGIIAQEVEAVMPGLVTENETHLSVQYNGLIGLLIEGMKEQQAQIEELKAKLG